MKAIPDMDVIQIDITNICNKKCSNCTRFIGHYKNLYFMELEQFKLAVDSLDYFPGRIGIIGGEPLLHPKFKEICDYLKTKKDRMQCGLWTTFPKGKEHYREIIVETFGAVYLNDHEIPVLHTPLLVSAEEVILDEKKMWYLIDHCWVQNTWSASINPNGAFFCEVAGAMALLYNEKGWDVTSDWWQRTPKDYIDQMEKYCRKCGAAVPLIKRESTEEIDDISPKNIERLKNIDSPKIKQGKYLEYIKGPQNDEREMFSFSEIENRKRVAAKYNIGLVGYVSPYLI